MDCVRTIVDWTSANYGMNAVHAIKIVRTGDTIEFEGNCYIVLGLISVTINGRQKLKASLYNRANEVHIWIIVDNDDEI